jgi:splicing factor 3A subunit 1
MILKNNAANPKFSFLKPEDPFHAHYRAMVAHNGGVAAGAGPPPPAAADASQPDAAAASGGGGGKPGAKPQTAKASTVGPKVAPLPLPEEEYRVKKPAGLFPLDVDTIMLAAQYVARNGRAFLSRLTEREGHNPAFDFLRPQHHLFNFFTSLVDAYSKCLVPSRELRERVKAAAAADARGPTLARLRRHAEHLRLEERRRVEKQNAEDAERMQQLMIDWHDFVVVETISFDDDDDEALPGATPLETAGGGAQQPAAAGARAEAAQRAAAAPAAPQALEDFGVGVPEPEMRIRRDYVPSVGPSTAGAAVPMAIDPISGKEVPLSEISEHLRISLLDPRWKEQKQLAAERNRDSNVLQGAEVFANVANFAKRRTDIFGDDDDEDFSEAKAAEQRAHERAQKEKVVWDGHAESIKRANERAQSRLDGTDAAAAGSNGAAPPRERAPRRSPPAAVSLSRAPRCRWLRARARVWLRLAIWLRSRAPRLSRGSPHAR